MTVIRTQHVITQLEYTSIPDRRSRPYTLAEIALELQSPEQIERRGSRLQVLDEPKPFLGIGKP